MIAIPVAEQAKLSRNEAMGDGDWNGTLRDRLTEYRSLPAPVKKGCVIFTVTDVIFNDDLPPRKHLTASMIEMLIERMARRGELDRN